MNPAVFVRGSMMRHVVVMTSASATGLLAMFGVDLIDMFFLTLLDEPELIAAVGFAGTLQFFLVSVSIGLQIALGALVSRSLGSQRLDLAGRYCSSALVFNVLVTSVIALISWWQAERLLGFLGAEGETLAYAVSYAHIILPNMPILVLGMGMAAATRAIGDARRALLATLAGSVLNALLDPLFIFTFGWGLEGAAYASVAARFVVLAVAAYALFFVHRLPVVITVANFLSDLRPIMQIAGPAMLTNLATPVGSSFVLMTMAQFGDSAVAGAAIVGRITPVAFAAIFSLSGAVGPIIGQNAGAGRFDRVRSCLRSAMVFNALYVLCVCMLLWAMGPGIVRVFSASGTAAELIVFYTQLLSWSFLFNGMLFVANASFNNLHRARWATGFNFAKVLFGIVPCVYFGAQWYGPKGVMAGEALGCVLFGVLAMATAFATVRKRSEQGPADSGETAALAAKPGFSSARTQMAQGLMQADSAALEDVAANTSRSRSK